MILKRSIIISLFFIVLTPLTLFAQSKNISVSPPPLPWFEFQQGQSDLRLGGNYASVTTESSPGKDDAVDVKAGGINTAYRYAFNNNFAFDFGYMIFGGSGSAGSSIDMGLLMPYTIPVNIELQLINTPQFNLILFAGYTWTQMIAWLDIRSGSYTYSYTLNAWLSGPQFGVQFAIKTGDIVFAPFFMMQNLSGSYELSGYAYSSGDISGTWSKIFGIEVIFRPINLTLSGVLQQIAAADQGGKVNTFTFSATYDFQWGADKR